MKKQLAPTGTGWFVLILAALLGSTVAGVAQTPITPLITPRTTPRIEPRGETYLPLTVAGVVVEIDASSGRMRPPTAEQVKALREALARRLGSGPLRNAQARQEIPVPIVHPDGTVSAELPAYLHEVSVVRITPEGTLRQDCAQGLEPATALLAIPAEGGSLIPTHGESSREER